MRGGHFRSFRPVPALLSREFLQRRGGILPDNLPAILLSSISQKNINSAPFFPAADLRAPSKAV